MTYLTRDCNGLRVFFVDALFLNRSDNVDPYLQASLKARTYGLILLMSGRATTNKQPHGQTAVLLVFVIA